MNGATLSCRGSVIGAPDSIVSINNTRKTKRLLKKKKSKKRMSDQWSRTVSHACLGCGTKMSMKDGHDHCVQFLGWDHACMAREDPAYCIISFILPARVRKARASIFSGRRLAPTPAEQPLAKLGPARVVIWNDHLWGVPKYLLPLY